MNEKIKDAHTDRLFEAVLSLSDLGECYNFFEDICTVAEIKAMAQRFAVAKMLFNQAKYHEITRDTGASPATISRVKRSLHYGADGYKRVLTRMKEQNGGKHEDY